MDFAIPVDHRVKINKNKNKKNKYLDLAREQKKTVKHKGDDNTSCNWCTWNVLQKLGKETGRVGNQRIN